MLPRVRLLGPPEGADEGCDGDERPAREGDEASDGVGVPSSAVVGRWGERHGWRWLVSVGPALGPFHTYGPGPTARFAGAPPRRPLIPPQ